MGLSQRLKNKAHVLYSKLTYFKPIDKVDFNKAAANRQAVVLFMNDEVSNT